MMSLQGGAAMKRCMKLIHLILEYTEKKATGGMISAPPSPDHTDELVEYHIELCAEAGYLRLDPNGYILELTWAGHEELEKWRARAQHDCK